MTIHYAETFEIITQESVQYGDAEERGFIDECLESDFRDMVDTLQGCEPSCWPVPSDDRDAGHIWFTLYESNEGTADYFETGDVENRSYHPKSSRDARYMLKAWKLANS